MAKDKEICLDAGGCTRLRKAIDKADRALRAAAKLRACGVDCRAEEALATAIRQRATNLLHHFGGESNQ